MPRTIEVEREMACTRAELVAWVRGLAREAPVRICGATASLAVGAGRLDIVMDERDARRVGALHLPVLGVRMRFHDVDEGARSAFLTYFDFYTRRGGG